MSRASVGAELGDLTVAIAATSPRVVTVWGPPGYGKAAFLRRYAERTDRTLIVCDLSGDWAAADLSRSVLEALVSGDRSAAARSAADRLAQPPELVASTSREALRREWPRSDAQELFVLDDPGAVLATPAGVDLLAELVVAMPPGRVLALAMRTALPPALQHAVEREPAAVVSADELALTADDVTGLALDAGLSVETAQAVHALTRGWPLVTPLVIELIRQDPAGALRDAEALPWSSLLAFAAHRTIAKLDDLVREGLVVAALLHGASQPDLLRVLGDGCDDLFFARLAQLPFVRLDGERAQVHPEIAKLQRERFGPLVKTLYERTLHVLTGDASYTRAAHVALDAGDVDRAAAILDASPPYTGARVPLGEYERILDRIDRGLVTRYPNVWLATIPHRAFSVDRATYVREAETVYYCLPRTASAEQRAVVLMHLSSGYTNVGRIEESDQLLNDALEGFAREDGRPRATLLRYCSTLRGIEGRFATARALAKEAATISGEAFDWGENQTLHYIEAHEAAYRGKYDRVVVIFDELLRRRAREELPLYLAYGATNGAFFAWVAGDDDAFQRYLGVLEDALTPGLELGLAPMLNAARGRPVQLDDRYPWPVIAAMTHLYRLGGATVHDEAVEMARAAAQSADERRDPYAQILAHAALYVLDPARRATEGELLRAVVEPLESPEMHEA
ncbi:MAG: hypothetical protein JO164_09140, partial [Candidatus Eremiobacteraeota bacterium]|nr:hypothetical protein [Candidatus Eremiobacteraeota bacterium]